MRPITSPLRHGDRGPEVTNLQSALMLLLNKQIIDIDPGFREELLRMLANESQEQIYADATAKSVAIFQEQQQQQPTGEVDPPTAEAMNRFLKELGALDSEPVDRQRLVGGRVVREDQRLFTGKVILFHEGETGTIRLGEDATDPEGRYTIRYELSAGLDGSNMRVAAFDLQNQLRAEAAFEEAGPITVLDLFVMRDAEPKPQRHVSGRIVLDYGLPAEGVTLRLYHHGFGGAETRLDETTTQALGRYAFAYDADGQAANFEVRAIDAAGNEVSLSQTKFGAREQEKLNLIAPGSVQPLADEYTRLSSAVQQQIGDITQLAIAREDAERRDLSLLHQATGWDARLLALAATATQLSANTDLQPDAVYGLLRAGLPADKQKLARVPVETVEKALTTARKAGIVNLTDQQQIEVTARFADFARDTRLAVKAPGAASSYGELLKHSGLSQDEQKRFATLYLNHRGGAQQLWREAEAQGIPEDTIKKLQLQGKLGYLTHNNAALTADLQQTIGELDKLPQLVDQQLYLKESWKTRINDLVGDDQQALQAFVPPAYPGEKADERLEAYAEDLARKVRISFPTQVIGHMIEQGSLPLPDVADEVKRSVRAVLKNAEAQDFQFGQTAIDKFINDHPAVMEGIAPEQIAATTEGIKTLQRVYQITPSNEAMQTLLDLGLKSAHDVVALPKDVFLERYGHRFPSRKQAELVYRKSEQISSVVYNFYSIARQTDTVPAVFGISGTPAQRQAAKDSLKASLKDFPTMESLFGSLDFCECEHCRSVLSPAAYLVDLLQFLDPEPLVWQNFLLDWEYKHAGAKYTDAFKQPYEALIERRPDLPHLELSCENTHTALPYIDLVNEILEFYVAHHKLTKEAAHDTGDATTPELLAEPQNLLADAYAKLEQARYPLTLPFDLWLETARQFCHYFELPLWKLLEIFRPTDKLFEPDATLAAYDRAAVFAEYLGVSSAEYAIFTDPDPLATWHELYGYPTAAAATTEAVDSNGQRVDLNSAKALARRLGVSYKELAALVRTGFVNPRLHTLAILYKLGIDVSDVIHYKQHADLLNQNEASLSPADQQLLAEVKAFEQRIKNLAQTFGVAEAVAKGWIDTPWANGDFKQVLLLADPDTGCNFDLTILRFANGDPANALAFLKLNLFVRLWRRLGWTIDETDGALQAFIPGNAPYEQANLDQAPLKTPLVYLAHLKALNEQLKLGKHSRIKLLTLWGNIPTTGKHSLYSQLFLTRAVLKTDDVFDHPQGRYLSAAGVLIKDHLLGLRAALNLTADEISRILADAGRDVSTAELTLEHVSLLYRYALLAKALRLSVRDLIDLKSLSGLNPFTPLLADPLDALANDHPYNQTLGFITIAQQVKGSGLSIEQLHYLLRHRFDPVGLYRPNVDALLALVRTLNSGIQTIRAEHAVPADPGTMTDDLLRQKMALVLPADVVQTFFSMWSGTIEYEVVATVAPADALEPQDFEAEPAIRRVSYNATRQEQTLVFRGVLFDEQKNDLQARFPSPLLATLLGLVQSRARSFFETHMQQQAVNAEIFSGFLQAADFALFRPLPPIDESLSDAQKQEQRREQQNVMRARRATLALAILPFLQEKLVRQLIVQTLTAAFGGDPALTEALLTDAALLADPTEAGTPLVAAFTAAGEQGVSASFFASTDGTGAALSQTTIVSADTALLDALRQPIKPGGTQSARFAGYFEVPANGAYRFFVAGKPDALIELRLDHLPDSLLKGVADNLTQYTELKAGVLYRFVLDAHQIGGGDVRLLVQSEGLPKGTLNRLMLYPQAATERVLRAHTLLGKVLTVLDALGLTERETRYLLRHAADFDDLNLSRWPTRAADDSTVLATQLFTQLLRLLGYVRLKRELAGDTDALIDLFDHASRLHPATADADLARAELFNELCRRVAELARRDPALVRAAATELGFTVTAAPVAGGLQVVALDFAQEQGIQRLWETLQVVELMGVPVAAVAGWTAIADRTATPEERAAIAKDLKQMVKARFEPDAWQRVAQPIHDKLRQRQRDALAAYIMHMHGFERMEQLFEYFLIDPGMEPVVQTSRIRLAISSAQFFIQRTLLNLERQVHPSVINAKHWEWMKRYRVWEANRKIFLFPENWLEPEFRDDKTFLFAELESALLQGDVNDDLVEDAFLGYLKQLEELARLNIVAMHLEDHALDPGANTLHVIGRTYNQPYKYFYRRYAHRMWTPWEPITTAIESDHLAPVIWRNRLYLFWVTFIDKADQNAQPGSSSGTDTLASVTLSKVMGDLKQAGSKKQIELQLHWSEYLQGEWSTRESGGFILAGDRFSVAGRGEVFAPLTVPLNFDPQSVFVHVTKEPYQNGEERGVYIHLGGSISQAFYLAGRNSMPEYATSSPAPAIPYTKTAGRATRYPGSGPFSVEFKRRITTEEGKKPVVETETPSILQQGGTYTLLPCDNTITLGSAEIASLVSPLFYQDNLHTFYVEPSVTEDTFAKWEEWVITTPSKEPEFEIPDWWKFLPIDKIVPELHHPIGPDDYLPGPDELSRFAPKQIRDWAIDPQTVIRYGDTFIGKNGKQDLAVLPAHEAIRSSGVPVNVSAGSEIEPDSVLVAFKAGKTGAAINTAGLNIVGTAGLNAAIVQNVHAFNALDGGLSQFEADGFQR